MASVTNFWLALSWASAGADIRLASATQTIRDFFMAGSRLNGPIRCGKAHEQAVLEFGVSRLRIELTRFGTVPPQRLAAYCRACRAAGVTRHTVLPTSSATSSAPPVSSATP